jgi:hypothetical protein
MALGAGAATAAADASSTQAPHASLGALDQSAALGAATGATTGAVRHATGTIADVKPNPLAGTGTDPLDNGVETQVADFKPTSTRAVTGPVAESRSIGETPVAGGVTKVMGAEQGSGTKQGDSGE